MKAAMQGLAQTQNHDHNHQKVLSDLTSRVKALKSLLAEKVFVDPAALDTLIKRRLLTVGYYNRFDIFRLVVDQRANRPVTLIREESEVKRTLHNESQSVSEALFASSDSII